MNERPGPSPLDAFRALVAGDAALETALARCEGAQPFVETATAIAARHGIALAPADLDPIVNPDPLGLYRAAGATIAGPAWPPVDFLPVALGGLAGGGLAVEWAHFAGAPLAEPFYTESVRRALARPLSHLIRRRTGLDDFIDDAAAEGAPEPDGFIFHMSRCGSTLASRMLAALPGATVVSEAAPLDSMARIAAGADWPEDRRIAGLRAMVGALGRRREPGARRFFVKLNAWHALELALFRLAFPLVPWVFLYREPAEVLASQMVLRGTELNPQAMPPGFYGIEDAAGLSGADYCALALARICAAALDAPDGGLFVDYAELPDAVAGRILPHFGLAASPAERRMMDAITGRHAKRPESAFDPAASAIGAEVRAAAERHLSAVYRRLETLRAG